MKQLLLVVLSFLLAVNAIGQNIYTVFKTNGQVERLDPVSKEWVPAQRKDTVKLSTRIQVASGGQVSILEGATGIVSKAGEGLFSVKRIVDAQRENAGGAMREAGKQIIDEVVSKTGKPTGKVYGVATRGLKPENNEISLEEKMAREIARKRFPLSATLSAPDGEGCVRLILLSGFPQPQCVNIAAFNRQRNLVRIVLPSNGEGGLWIAPGSTTVDYIPLLPDKDTEYIVFPVDGPFNTSSLAYYLRGYL